MLFRPEDVARGHDGLREAYDRFLTKNFPLPDGVDAVEDELGDVKAWRVGGPDAPRGNVVLHFHGGGYLIGSAKGSLEYASRLAAAVDGTCYTVDYRLAPEHPYPAAIDDAVSAYRALLARGIPASSILVSRRIGRRRPCGCAGAGAPHRRRSAAGGDPCSRRRSPTSRCRAERDGAFNGDDPAANRDLLTFMGASYFQGHEPTDPLVSPLFGDLAACRRYS